MGFLVDASDVLLTLLQERGPNDATYCRMTLVYRDVSEVLDCRPAFEQMLAGVRASQLAVA